MPITPISFAIHGDGRGELIACESGKNVPFDIQRVYYMYGIPAGQSRGFHAHRRLRQLAVCVSGALDMVVEDGHTRQTFRLDSPDKGLLIEGLIWREMHDFAPNTVLMVMADALYDEADYIRDYPAFCEAVQEAQA